MSVLGQKIFTTVLTNDILVFDPNMGITSVSIILVSGLGSFKGSLPIGSLQSIDIPLQVGVSVGISSDGNLPIDGLIIDCRAGGVINVIAKE